ncbi:TPA: DUF1983 domain-containing protein [Vibrio metschnikovii]
MSRSGFRAGRDQSSLTENIELLTGQRGDGGSKAVTYRDLAKLGVLTLRRGSGGKVIPEIAKPDHGGGNHGVLRPTQPQGVSAYGGFGSILVKWENPTYAGHAHAEVFRNSENVLADATLIATVNANVFSDIVPVGSGFYYWIRFVNVNNIQGAHSTPAFAKTSPNISDVIDEIGEQMRESVLIKYLEKEINLVDESLNEETKKRLSEQAKINEAIKNVSVETNKNKSEIRETQRVVSDINLGLSQKISTVESRVGEVSSAVQSNSRAISETNRSLSQQINTVQSELKGTKSAVQTNTNTIAQINKDGTTAFKSMWSVKAQAGQITAGIGILAKSDGTSQVAVSASQFFVFDPKNPNASITPTFAIDKGRVVIPKALIENATIQILQAQKITADFVRAGVAISSPKINGGQVRGGDAGFGAGGPYSGYRTFIHSNGLLQTNHLQANGGYINNVLAQNVTIAENCTIRGHLDGATGSFKGTVEAEKIIGDLVSADVVKLSRTPVKTSGWVTIGRISGKNNTRNVASIMLSPCVLTLLCSAGARKRATANGACRVLINGSVVAQSQSAVSAQSTSDGAGVTQSISFCGPVAVKSLAINEKFEIVVQVTFSSSNRAGSLNAASDTVAQLFRKGSAFD